MSNTLDPDQDGRSVGFDLSPTNVQRLSANDKLPLADKELVIMTQERFPYTSN